LKTGTGSEPDALPESEPERKRAGLLARCLSPFSTDLSRSARGREGNADRHVASCHEPVPIARELTIHHGRHTFCSHAAKLRTLVEVRDAAGHSNIATTSIYLHTVTDDDGEVGGMFAFVR